MPPTIRLKKILHQDTVDHEENYNSHFHTYEQCPNLLQPDCSPHSFSRWLPLIARSQNIPSSLIQRITLTSRQGKLLIAASEASIHTKQVNRIYKEEIEEEITPSFCALVFPPDGLFMRLDGCSAKDGARRTMPLRNVDDILLQIPTSRRAMNMVLDLVARNEDIDFIFLPFNPKISTDKEYRVFCAAPRGEITAISQYRWHKPSLLAERKDEVIQKVIARILVGVRNIHRNILEENAKMGDSIAAMMLRDGFTFDVTWEEEDGRCELIELNSFGARSGCGACLYHWLTDFDILYGLTDRENNGELKEVEFRISV